MTGHFSVNCSYSIDLAVTIQEGLCSNCSCFVMGSLKAAVDDLKAAFVSAFYSLAYPLMLTAIYYLHR